MKGIKEKKEENCKKLIIDFMTTRLKLAQPLEIQTAHRIGRGKSRPLYAKLLDPNNIKLIFANVANLKDVVNDDDEPFYVDAQLTEQQNTERRRRQEIKRENRLMPVSHQLDIVSKGNTLIVENEKYEKCVPPPTAGEVLTTSNEDNATSGLHRYIQEREKFMNQVNLWRMLPKSALLRTFKGPTERLRRPTLQLQASPVGSVCLEDVFPSNRTSPTMVTTEWERPFWTFQNSTVSTILQFSL